MTKWNGLSLSFRRLALLNYLLLVSWSAHTSSASSIFTIYDKRALEVLDTQAELVVLAGGFSWTEGPVWDKQNKRLLFSDIPNNKVMSFSDRDGVSTLYHSVGFSNGLIIDGHRNLILMLSRSRNVSKLHLDHKKAPKFQILTSHFEGERFNSPNDGVLHKSGALFFTDPPYGLEGGMSSPEKELEFQGVYRFASNGDLTLVDKELTFPNGIALSPKHDVLYVAVSDENNPSWYRYELDESGNVLSKLLFYQTKSRGLRHGMPNGLKVHSSGIVFATGPGGVWLFSPEGQRLAHISMPGFTANLAFDENETNLYLTASDELRMLPLKTSSP